jgi:hypothetical protein
MVRIDAQFWEKERGFSAEFAEPTEKRIALCGSEEAPITLCRDDAAAFQGLARIWRFLGENPSSGWTRFIF